MLKYQDDNRRPILQGWRILNFGTCAVAEGNVYGDPRFQDGQLISTSYIKIYSLSEGKINTKNTCYYLGEPAKSPPADNEVIIKKEEI
jgi:hypothetical protein